MGAQTSAQRDEKSQEDASAEELSAEVNAISEEDNVVDAKVQQKNGQISSLNGKADEQAALNDRSEDNTLADEVDDVSMSQKEEAPETMDSLQAVGAPQVNGEKEENESPDSNITAAEEKEVEEKPGEANEVGFKKIFKFVGFKFTLKKDKTEKTDPVQLLMMKDKDVEGEASVSEETKNEAGTSVEVKSEEKNAAEPETSTVEADPSETTAEAVTPVDAPSDNIEGDTAEAAPEDASGAAEDRAEEKESEDPASTANTPHDQEATQSPFRRFFSNLRKKASIKKPKEEDPKEKAVEAGIKEGEETAEAVMEEEVPKENEEVGGEAMEVELATTPVEAIPEPSTETEAAELVTDDIKKEVQTEDTVETSKAIIDDVKPVDEKVKDAVDEDRAQVEVTTEAALLSSREKVKSQGSPLKKLFTGAGLKKLSTKKQKRDKKDFEAKLTESGEQGAEQLQSSTESAEVQKPESGASSPEESGEHAIDVEASHEADGEVSSSDEGKKKEGIMPWSSFKKLVTPKKRVKRPSESEDDAAGEKAKSATLSSTESAGFVENEKEEPEPTEEEPKTETTEKLEGSTEEHKKMKMDTSVSWEALMCMGGNKKRTRKTSDSEDDENHQKIEEEASPGGEQQAKITETLIISAGEAEQENTMSSPEPATSPTAGESTWDTLKRLVSHRKKTKAEEKTDESGGEQMVSDSEIPKEESSFSLRKLIPGRRKKKQLSSDLGSGEEDSDTPAVVPLSEYYNEQTETKEHAEPELSVETVETEEAASITQAQSSIEERSPSWISATAVVENHQEIPHDQLSDIPEEGAATPKSADTTIAEDIVEQTSEAVICQEPELSVAEVSAEMIPATLEETTLLSNEPEPESLEVLQEAVELISGLPSLTSGEITEVPLEEAALVPELTPQIEFAGSESKAVLTVHDKNEATAICTGLSTKEIEKVEVEKTVIPILNPLAEISNALSTELPLEDKVNPIEVADATVDPVFEAQVEHVESTFLDTPVQNTIEHIPEHEKAAVCNEPDVEKIVTITNSQTEAEIIEAPPVTENTPKMELIDTITPTVENPISIEIVKVTELHVEVKSDVMEETATIKEITAVDEVREPAAQEMVSSPTETNQSTVNEVCEADIAVVAPAEEFAIIKETVCLVSPPSKSMESQQVNVTEATVMESLSVAVAEPAVDDLIQVQVTEVGLTEAQETKEEGAIEETGLVIAQVVIQSSLKKVSDAETEPEGPVAATPTTEGALTDQAVTTIEQQIENVAEEKSVIADIPPIQVEELETSSDKLAAVEVPVMDENPSKEIHEAFQVIETVPFTVEVTQSIVDEVTKEAEDVVKDEVDEIKPKVELMQILDVNVSEEEVVGEIVEVMEQTEGEIDVKAKDVKEEINVEAEVQKVPQAHIDLVAQQVQQGFQQSEVAAVVLEEIVEVLTPEKTEEKSDAAVVTEENRVAEILETQHQPEELIAEVLVSETTQMVIHTAQVVEEVKEIQLEEGMEINAIVSTVETKEATAEKDAPSLETTPDTTTPAPAVADDLDTNMKYNIATIEEPSVSTQTAPEEPQTEATAVSHDSQVNSVEEEAAVTMATTVTSTAETVEEKVALVKCAAVMAQVIEVIEEAVNEIETISSTELTAAS